MQNLDLDNIYSHHQLTEEMVHKFETLSAKAKELAMLINELCPEGRERSLALTNLENAFFWSNASIFRSESKRSTGVKNPTSETQLNSAEHETDWIVFVDGKATGKVWSSKFVDRAALTFADEQFRKEGVGAVPLWIGLAEKGAEFPRYFCGFTFFYDAHFNQTVGIFRILNEPTKEDIEALRKRRQKELYLKR